MSHHRCLVLIIVAFVVLTSTASFAEECFNSSRKLNDDAQTIRLKAMEMGWSMGKSSSIAAASIIKSKAELYPKDDVEICLRTQDGALRIKIQSRSRDAGKAKWHKISANKIENKTQESKSRPVNSVVGTWAR